jgi:hypothetical protein
MASIVLSSTFGVAGALLFFWQAWRRDFDPLVAACALLAGSVLLYAL